MKNRWLQVLIVAVGICLIWASAKSLWDLRRAGGRLEEAKEGLAQMRKDNQELKRKLEEVSSSEFVEKEARDKLNLQRPGEVVVLMTGGGLETPESTVTAERALTNPEKWWKLLFDE